MSWSGSGKPDLVLEGMELLFQQEGGLASFGAKVVPSMNEVDPSCTNSITDSACRAKCSNILHDIAPILWFTDLSLVKTIFQWVDKIASCQNELAPPGHALGSFITRTFESFRALIFSIFRGHPVLLHLVVHQRVGVTLIKLFSQSNKRRNIFF